MLKTASISPFSDSVASLGTSSPDAILCLDFPKVWICTLSVRGEERFWDRWIDCVTVQKNSSRLLSTCGNRKFRRRLVIKTRRLVLRMRMRSLGFVLNTHFVLVQIRYPLQKCWAQE